MANLENFVKGPPFAFWPKLFILIASSLEKLRFLNYLLLFHGVFSINKH